MQDLVEKIYTVFSKYPKPKYLQICNCESCMPDETHDRILKTSLKDISLDDICSYNDSCALQDMNFDEIKYFIPRYLDLIAKSKIPSHSLECVFSNYSPFQQDKFSISEWELLEQYFRKYLIEFQTVEAWDKHVNFISSLFEFYYRLGLDIKIYLEEFEKHITPESIRHFHWIYVEEIDQTKEHKCNSFHNDCNYSNIIFYWAISPRVEALILHNTESFLEKEMFDKREAEKAILLRDFIKYTPRSGVE